MTAFDCLREKINKISGEILAVDGAYPTWTYGDLMQLIDVVEEEYENDERSRQDN